MMANLRHGAIPPRRETDDDDVDMSKLRVDSSRGRWIINKSISLEGAVSFTVALVTAVYCFGVMRSDIDHGKEDNARTQQWLATHAQADVERDQRLDTRLQGIEQRLDTLIGQVDGVRRRQQ